MRFIFCLAALMSMALPCAFAQVNPTESRQHVILKWSPLSMFDVDNTIQFGVEAPIKNSRVTFQQELGYGHASFNIWYAEQGTKPDKSTIKSRTQVRYYFLERPLFRAYVAGEYLYKRVVASGVRWTGMDCSGTGGCSYFENKRISNGRFVNAIHAKAGWQFYFSNRTSLDVYTGIGLRQARSRMITPEVNYVNLDNTWGLFLDNSAGVHQVLPSLAVGFQLGFALGKFKKMPVKDM